MRKSGKMTITSTQSFSPVLGIKDGIIVTKDERYIKLMEISPINYELRSASEKEDIISLFSSALSTMPGTVHIKIMNVPSDISRFTGELYELMRNETSAGCRSLQKDQIELIEDISINQSISRRFFLSFEYENDGILAKKPDFFSVRSTLNRQERSIAASLEACGNAVLSTNDTDYILSALYCCACKSESLTKPFPQKKREVISRYEKRYGKTVPESRVPVNDFISPGKIDFSISPQYALIDGKYTMYCYIPSSSYPVRCVGGWTQTLFSAYEGVDVDIWIKREDIAKVQERLTFELKTNRIRQKNTEDVSRNYNDIESALYAGYYLQSAISAGETFNYFSIMLTITGDTVDELLAKYRDIKDYYITHHLKLRKCFFQQEEAYLATLPLADYNQGIFNKSRRNITGSQLGSCYPFTAYELNDEGGIFFGVNPRYMSPVFINPNNRKIYSNGNTLILGPSGSGKSYLLMTMLLRLRQKGIQVYVIAPYKGTEFMRSCEAVGGEFVKIAPGSAQNINIMEIRKYDSSAVLIDGELASSSSILTTKIQQLERFFSLLVKDITTREEHILDDSLMETYKRFGITVSNASLNDPEDPGRYRKMPVLGDLYEELMSRGAPAQRLTEALSRYVTGSARSFNQQTNVDLNNKYIVFDVSDMTNEMLAVGMFICLDFVLDASRADKTKPKAISIDELWRLMAASRMTAEFTQEVFKIIRGYGGFCMAATQDLGDIIKDEIGSAIINNAKIKFFLPMEKKEADEIAKIVDISAEEMKKMKISKAVKPGADRKILMVAGSNHVFVSIRTSPLEHDLITTNAEDLARIARRNLEMTDEI